LADRGESSTFLFFDDNITLDVLMGLSVDPEWEEEEEEGEKLASEWEERGIFKGVRPGIRLTLGRD
jgi:hypothetical protein